MHQTFASKYIDPIAAWFLGVFCWRYQIDNNNVKENISSIYKVNCFENILLGDSGFWIAKLLGKRSSRGKLKSFMMIWISRKEWNKKKHCWTKELNLDECPETKEKLYKKRRKIRKKKLKYFCGRCAMHGSTMSPANQYPTQFFSPVNPSSWSVPFQGVDPPHPPVL